MSLQQLSPCQERTALLTYLRQERQLLEADLCEARQLIQRSGLPVAVLPANLRAALVQLEELLARCDMALATADLQDLSL